MWIWISWYTVSRVTNSYVEMIDINSRAVHLTKMNIKRYKDFKGKTYVSNIYQKCRR